MKDLTNMKTKYTHINLNKNKIYNHNLQFIYLNRIENTNRACLAASLNSSPALFC
jgi:hypothetical protein